MSDKPKCPSDWETGHGDYYMYQGQEDRWFCGACEREEEQQRIAELEEENARLQEKLSEYPTQAAFQGVTVRAEEAEEKVTKLRAKIVQLNGHVHSQREVTAIANEDTRRVAKARDEAQAQVERLQGIIEGIAHKEQEAELTNKQYVTVANERDDLMREVAQLKHEGQRLRDEINDQAEEIVELEGRLKVAQETDGPS